MATMRKCWADVRGGRNPVIAWIGRERVLLKGVDAAHSAAEGFAIELALTRPLVVELEHGHGVVPKPITGEGSSLESTACVSYGSSRLRRGAGCVLRSHKGVCAFM